MYSVQICVTAVPPGGSARQNLSFVHSFCVYCCVSPDKKMLVTLWLRTCWSRIGSLVYKLKSSPYWEPPMDVFFQCVPLFVYLLSHSSGEIIPVNHFQKGCPQFVFIFKIDLVPQELNMLTRLASSCLENCVSCAVVLLD